MLVSVAWRSLISRRKTVLLTYLSLVVSISVLISVEHIRVEAKESFNRTISGVDLLVGAPSGDLNLLLYSVFRMGSPTNNIRYDSFQTLKANDSVAWAVPISLGDSHRGFRVMGTNSDYFRHFSYGNDNRLTFTKGKPFEGLFDAVIGAEVAASLNYQQGDKIVIAHGIGSTSFVNHDQAPFTVVGVLAPTGTPVDKTVHVSLPAIEAIHLPSAQLSSLLNAPDAEHPVPDSITAVLLGLTNKFATFTLQRQINNYQADRLMAVLPGVAMAQLWELMGSVENVLRIIGYLVLLASLFGLATMLLASMNERRQEIAVFRTLGASPALVVTLVIIEATLIALSALLTSVVVVVLVLLTLEDWLTAEYGLFLSYNILSPELLMLSGIIVIATFITALIPGIEAYQKALHSQLSD
ncbi:ABC transporter permease [Alteromonas oceanisediminis]|uniref:ABC transporter permease n=1 Tax=Alteromonas oceanisediminis TaxID=2836180 RepID=UPI001BDA5640|nr:FtsX-like permease family protein [Alteromonas oceanisediminis]MBT0585949.1 ABC transporter permease [Alteromonas oceanisediminis]